MRDREAEMVKLLVESPSASFLLLPGDIDGFQRGGTKKEVLNGIQWRGNFMMAGEYAESDALAIGYNFVFPHGQDIQHIRDVEGEWLVAIFIGGKFDKFVRWPKPETVLVDYQGTPWSRPKPIWMGDIGWLTRAIESDPVSIKDIEKELKTRPGTPSHIDLGLTITYLLLRGTSDMTNVKDYKTNAELRNMFNASRLEIGNTKAEVEAVFKSKPIATGKAKAGSFCIYGSNESLKVDPALRFSNVLVVFTGDKATAIYSVPGGAEWRREMQDRFVDFPG